MAEYWPSLPEFLRLARHATVVPVFREVVADRDTPVSMFEKVALRSPYAYLLESVEGGDRLGRYSFLGYDPAALFVSRSHEVLVKSGDFSIRKRTSNPFGELTQLLGHFRAAELPGLPRFWGGAVGYLGYDMVRCFESLPTFLADDLKVPDASFQLTDQMLVFDRFSHTVKIVACVSVNAWGRTPFPRPRLVARSYREACAKIERTLQVMQRGEGAGRVSGPGGSIGNRGLRIVSNLSPRRFMQAVQRAKRYITNGDAIQVVLSQRFSTPVHIPPFDIYRALRLVNPSPYMYFLRFRDLYLIGSSPEILVRKEGPLAETRPIAGTRPRGRTPQEDLLLERALLTDPKERAEHLMLVDLGRNDLGRVCQVGSIRIPEFMTVERYSHVMHLVSSVTGRLAAKQDAFDLLTACFPAGTVTGAPKIRAMQIIEELEPVRRGPYAGAVGYFAFTGNMDMAITIRTLLLKDGIASVQAGAGIVADSLPRRELQETRNKAAALFEAVRRAEQGFL